MQQHSSFSASTLVNKYCIEIITIIIIFIFITAVSSICLHAHAAHTEVVSVEVNFHTFLTQAVN
jgi:hypothetical protein